MSATCQSKGHLFFDADWEYFQIGNEVYRAPTRNPLDVDGYRQGARFECYEHSLGLLKKCLSLQPD